MHYPHQPSTSDIPCTIVINWCVLYDILQQIGNGEVVHTRRPIVQSVISTRSFLTQSKHRTEQEWSSKTAQTPGKTREWNKPLCFVLIVLVRFLSSVSVASALDIEPAGQSMPPAATLVMCSANSRRFQASRWSMQKRSYPTNSPGSEALRCVLSTKRKWAAVPRRIRGTTSRHWEGGAETEGK